MAAASPSSATAQPGCPAVQGIPPFHPFLPDVLMEAPRPPAKGWVALLRLPCRQNPGMLPHPSQPRVPVLNLAALAVSLALQEGDPLPRTGVTPGFISLAHPRGKEMEAWHSMAPMAPCPSCLSAPSVAGLSEGDPWILATGKPQESHQSLPEAWAPPLLSPGAGEPLPTPAGPAHASTSKPLWDAAWGIWTQSHLSGDTHGKGLWIILCCAPCLGQCEPLDVSRQSQPWVRGSISAAPGSSHTKPSSCRIINEESIFRHRVWSSVTALPEGFTIRHRQVSLLLQLRATSAEKPIKDIQLEEPPEQKN